ncbi:SpoIIIAH-like family protein [Bacillus sp. 2205SS5-2]|uniref:SpoIIIAH-like family protein n=1 Tax=Bacillus sp. 2205SS5-2 TaxID=3109031 RepID=UPI003003AD5D
MLLKKQTVWLLTMLSLVVVLSVYYVMSPTDTPNMAAVDTEGEETAVTEESPSDAVAESDVEIVSEITDDPVFTALRMDIVEERDEMIGDLMAIVASADASTSDKNTAYGEMQKIRELNTQEKTLEFMIKSNGYEDVFVRTVDGKVKVTVKAGGTEPTRKEANNIIRMVRDELGTLQNVAVEFQPLNE